MTTNRREAVPPLALQQSSGALLNFMRDFGIYDQGAWRSWRSVLTKYCTEYYTTIQYNTSTRLPLYWNGLYWS